MIKKISTSELRIGMFIDDLECEWDKHPFMNKKISVSDSQVIQKIASAGIRYALIDTALGSDVDDIADANSTETAANYAPSVEASIEVDRARALYREATTVIRNMMEDARLGKQVQVNALEPVAERMVQSAMRNHHALTSVTRIKTKDEYTFMHCVSVAGLMTTFAREQGLDDETIHQVALGGLVHDIGKTLVPDKVLNKPGKLEGDEFSVMKRHVDYSGELLAGLGLSQIAIDVTMQHHERMDGTGYPLKLSGEQISHIGQMSAIVDVYDALTSVRVYKSAWEPTQTLKKLIEWSPGHFNRDLVQHFIRCLGIYPMGSLVELESGLLGIVIEASEDMLRPKLRIIYNAKYDRYERPHDIDMVKAKNDRIINAALPAQYKIDLAAFL